MKLSRKIYEIDRKKIWIWRKNMKLTPKNMIDPKKYAKIRNWSETNIKSVNFIFVPHIFRVHFIFLWSISFFPKFLRLGVNFFFFRVNFLYSRVNIICFFYFSGEVSYFCQNIWTHPKKYMKLTRKIYIWRKNMKLLPDSSKFVAFLRFCKWREKVPKLGKCSKMGIFSPRMENIHLWENVPLSWKISTFNETFPII